MLTDPNFVPFEWHAKQRKLSLADIINEWFESLQEKSFYVDLDSVYVDFRRKRKYIMIKNKTIDYQGQKSTIILINEICSNSLSYSWKRNEKPRGSHLNKLVNLKLAQKPLKII